MKWLLCSVLALGLLGCGDDDGGTVDAGPQDSGNNDSGNNDSGSSDSGSDSALACGATGLSARSPSCDACLRSQCCFELGACSDVTACVGLVECLRGCDEPDASTDCTSGCAGVHGVPVPYNPLLICQFNRCEAACPFLTP